MRFFLKKIKVFSISDTLTKLSAAYPENHTIYSVPLEEERFLCGKVPSALYYQQLKSTQKMCTVEKSGAGSARVGDLHVEGCDRDFVGGRDRRRIAGCDEEELRIAGIAKSDVLRRSADVDSDAAVLV